MRLGLALAVAVALGAPAIARADDTDGAYGRLDGDLLVMGGLGPAVTLGAPALGVDARALYLSTAGIYVRYVDSFNQDGATFDRSIATGVELRPLFLGRWAQDLEHGPPRFDLWLDSFSIDFGAAWQAPRAKTFVELPAFEMALGFEFPLLQSASGPYLGALADFRLDDLGGHDDRDVLEQGSVFLFTVSWHQMVKLGLADFRDRR